MRISFADAGSLKRWRRRDVLRAAGSGLLGLAAYDLAPWRATAGDGAFAARKHHKACVFLFLFGGPSHIDLWDMKPHAPAEVRGEFSPIATRVSGIEVCEHLPRLAGMMDKVCLLRSMTHRMNVHGPACSEVFSGREYFAAPTTDQARREDWPSLSSLAMRYGRLQGGLPPSVVVPWYLQFPGQAKRIAGQTGGRMGEQYNALLLQGDSETATFETAALQLDDHVSLARLEQRRQLLSRLDRQLPPGALVEEFNRQTRRAYDLLSSGASQVLNLEREPVAMRERYGKSLVGQSLLMTRRLIEAGTELVTVNWQDETKIDGVNTCWDTHQNNFQKLKTLLCPLFDQVFPTFIADLDERGLLEDTLVIAVGEFGRTPKLGQFTQSSNTQATGRDHWPHAFTALVAGGGMQGGQIYGSTNRDGGYVSDKPVTPADLTATVLDHLGIDYTRRYADDFQQRQNLLSEGRPLRELL